MTWADFSETYLSMAGKFYEGSAWYFDLYLTLMINRTVKTQTQGGLYKQGRQIITRTDRP